MRFKSGDVIKCVDRGYSVWSHPTPLKDEYDDVIHVMALRTGAVCMILCDDHDKSGDLMICSSDDEGHPIIGYVVRHIMKPITKR